MATVKELKDDALVEIKINKSFYYMLKNTLYNLFVNIKGDKPEEKEEYIKEIMSKSYSELSEEQKSFFTVTLAILEVERVAQEQNLFEEKEITLPKDIKKD
jgi:hypothetical protein